MQIQFDRLNDVVLATETLPLGSFNMATIDCGTAGCMIGNYYAFLGRRGSRPRFGSDQMVQWLGIDKLEFNWLFAEWTYVTDEECDIRLATDWCRGLSAIGQMQEVTQQQAISRLRKFIAYKRRKHELIHDPKYGVKDTARHVEGNHNVVMLAKLEVVEAMALATAN